MQVIMTYSGIKQIPRRKISNSDTHRAFALIARRTCHMTNCNQYYCMCHSHESQHPPALHEFTHAYATEKS